MKKSTLVLGAAGAILLAAGLAAAPMIAGSATPARVTGPLVGTGIVPPTTTPQSANRRAAAPGPVAPPAPPPPAPKSRP